MKKIIALAILLSATAAYAYWPPRHAPNVGNYSSDAIYYTSRTYTMSVGTHADVHVMTITTYPALLHGIFFNQFGNAGESWCKIFASRSGTSSVAELFRIPTYSSGIPNPAIFDIWVDSGITIWNEGTWPIDMTFMFRTK